MVKSLRFLLLAFLGIIFCGNAMAEDIIWQEDFSSYKADDVPTGGDYQYACENGGGTTKIYAANIAGGTSPELLVAKKGGSFTAVVPLNGKNGDMFISYVTNRTDLTIDVNGATVGEKARVGNADSYALTVEAGTESLTIKIYMPANVNSNARLDDIKLYQGEAKKPAGLSWGKASTSVTYGGDYANIPTLQNSNNLTVSCSSTNEAVCTVTDDGVITVEGPGETVISAVFEGNDEYEAQTVTITITVKEPVDDNAKGQKNNPYLMTDEDFATLVNGLQGDAKTGTIYVKAYITNIEEVSTEHGNATFKVAAEQGNYNAEMKLKAFRCKFLENKSFTSEDQIAVDDEVIIRGQIQWYGSDENKEPQFIQGCYIYSLNGATTDGIRSVAAGQNADGTIFDLSGRRIEKAQKGLYILNGKKVVIK